MKYLTIKNEIIERINDHTILSKDISGSEKSLCNIYGVSRVTLRKIFGELEAEGYLKKIPNKGWIINSIKAQDITKIHSFSEAIANNGFTPRIKLLRKEFSDNCNIPKLGKSKNGYLTIERIYFADETPYCYTTSILSLEQLPNLKFVDFSSESLYKILKEMFQLEIVSVTQVIDPIVANVEIAEYLEIDNGTPCLKLEAMVHAKIMNKVFIFENYTSYIRTDQIKYITHKSL